MPGRPDAHVATPDAALGTPPAVQIDLSDPPSVLLSDGRRQRLNPKTAALLALAALEPSTTRRRAALLLWPDSPEPLARNNLRTLVHRLARQLGVDLLGSGEHIALHPDVARMRTAQVDELLAALDAGGPHRCELLGGGGLDGLEEFQAWLASARQRATHGQLAELERALAVALGEADAARAEAIARACVALEPLSERWHRQLMHTLTACGDRAAALVAYEDCKATLRDNLGAVPDERTRSLHVRILQSQGVAPSSPVAPTPARSATALVERDAALARLEAAHAAGRHVALRGEAGVGKTRLLRQHAEGRAVLVVTLHADARHEPYAALAQVLQQVQQGHALRLGRAERIELARVAPAAFPDVQPSSAGVSTARLRAALCHWARRLHEQGVRLLALDDMHYADAASQAALASLLAPGEPAPHPLRLLVAHRSGEVEAVLADAIAAAEQHQCLDTVALERLSLQGIEALLRSLGHADAQVQAHAQALLQATGGNPLFVIELTLFSHLEHIDGRLGAVGTNLQALLQSRLAGCSAPARQLAYVAGVARGDFSVELAASLTAGSPLDLMPAWIELQQRGLFADHGLAHDLVRDAVLAGVPQAIEKALHRQVAEHLERSGRSGAPVMRHWLAADDCQRAFPHAELHQQALSLAGLDHAEGGARMFELIEGLSGDFLRDKLWMTAELSVWAMPQAVFARLPALVARVELLAQDPATLAWLAFERSRLLLFRERDARAAYDTLSNATAGLALPAAVRVRIELWLSQYANQIGAQPHVHARRAADAAAGVPQGPRYETLHREVSVYRAAFLLEHSACVKETARRIHTARADDDLGAERESRTRMAYMFKMAGFPTAAARHFERAAQGLSGEDRTDWLAENSFNLGQMRLHCGHYNEAIACFDTTLHSGGARAGHARPFLAWAWAMLGRVDLAAAIADATDPADLEGSFAIYAAQASVRAEIEHLRGGDPIAPLVRALQRMRELGAAPAFLGLVELQHARRYPALAHPLALAERVLELLRPPHPTPGNLVPALLAVAQAGARVGSARARVAALEGASMARRGRASTIDHRPATLCAFADVLQATDPHIAQGLRQVAVRWVRHALPHVPEAARESFVVDHPVHTDLLALPCGPQP